MIVMIKRLTCIFGLQAIIRKEFRGGATLEKMHKSVHF